MCSSVSLSVSERVFCAKCNNKMCVCVCERTLLSRREFARACSPTCAHCLRSSSTQPYAGMAPSAADAQYAFRPSDTMQPGEKYVSHVVVRITPLFGIRPAVHAFAGILCLCRLCHDGIIVICRLDESSASRKVKICSLCASQHSGPKWSNFQRPKIPIKTRPTVSRAIIVIVMCASVGFSGSHYAAL